MTTITHEQYEAAWEKFRNMDEVPMAKFGIVLAELGITIAPPHPSPEMVKLAAYVVQKRVAECQIAPSERSVQDMEAGALAALQHVEKLVKGAPRHTCAAGVGDYISRFFILTAIESK